MKIAFVGLGNIGSGCAANLVRAGFDVTVTDLDASKVAALAAVGAIAAESVAQAVDAADIVFTSLPGPAQIVEVGRDLLAALKPGATWVEMSTNDLDTAHELAQDAAAAGVYLLDAPVSGGSEGAAAGTLSIFVGGHVDDVARVMPLFHAMGNKIDHLGAHGAGIVAKIAQVTLCYTQTITLIEALVLGAKGGVDPVKMLDLIQNSAGSSYAATTYGPEILAGSYDESFPLSHATKDLQLAMEMASSLRAELPLTAGVAALYAEAEAEYGSSGAHCLAAQLVERRNDMILHTQLNQQNQTEPNQTGPDTE